MTRSSSKRKLLKLDLLQDRKIDCLQVQACACSFQPGNFTGWSSEGVKR